MVICLSLTSLLMLAVMQDGLPVRKTFWLFCRMNLILLLQGEGRRRRGGGVGGHHFWSSRLILSGSGSNSCIIALIFNFFKQQIDGL